MYDVFKEGNEFVAYPRPDDEPRLTARWRDPDLWMLDRSKFPRNPEELEAMLVAEDIFSSAMDPSDIPKITDSWDDNPDGYVSIPFECNGGFIPVAVPYWYCLSPLDAAQEVGYYDSTTSREYCGEFEAFDEEEAIEAAKKLEGVS